MTSSARYAIDLAPDSRLRMLVMSSGWLFLLVGVAIIMHLQVPVFVRVLLTAVWVADAGWELKRQGFCHARIRRLHLDPTELLTGHDRFGKQYELQILSGSFVLRRWACLRLGFDDGQHYVELFSSSGLPAATWRRLRLIWRHAL